MKVLLLTTSYQKLDNWGNNAELDRVVLFHGLHKPPHSVMRSKLRSELCSKLNEAENRSWCRDPD